MHSPFLQSDKILVASVDGKKSLPILDIEERQVLKDLEDRIIDNLLILDSTESTISSLIEKYDQFTLENSAHVEENNVGSFDPVAVALLEMKKEVILCKTKLQTLHAKLQGLTNLVCIAGNGAHFG